MKLLEYQAKSLLKKWDLPIPHTVFIDKIEDISAALKVHQISKGVIKAQVLTGGRGKAGGIKTFSNHEDAMMLAVDMFGHKLITKQTGSKGVIVESITIDHWTEIVNEIYLAIMVDRAKSSQVVMISTEGGVDIEEVAEKTPQLIHYIYPNEDGEIDFSSLNELMKLEDKKFNELCTIIDNLYKAFMHYDADLLEVNPLAIDDSNEFKIVDCKMIIDDNALFRQEEIRSFPDKEKTKIEIEAAEYGLNYIGLDGNIGCMVNGAGLAMSTMDTIKFFGGSPANFLDVGGSASESAISKAFELIASDQRVKSILVNIFGGIMQCDIIARGIIGACKQSGLQLPLIVRLEGTNSQEGKALIENSGLNIITASTIDEAAKKAISTTK